MCKILALSNLDKVKVTPKLIEAMRDLVCKTSDKDGFGFAVSSHQGNLWGDKTTTPKTYSPYHKYELTISKLNLTINSRLKFGIPGNKNHALIAHGRYSTNTISIENTHPYVSKEYALVHNGVVSDVNNRVEHLCETDNDTEVLLHLWEKNQIEAIAKNASGYYALAILDRQGQLHVIRDSIAMLYLSYSRTIDSFIVATTEDILNSLSKEMRWSITKPELIKDNSYIVFKGNEVVYNTQFTPINQKYATFDSKVLGYTYNEILDNETKLDSSEDLLDCVSYMHRGLRGNK